MNKELGILLLIVGFTMWGVSSHVSYELPHYERVAGVEVTIKGYPFWGDLLLRIGDAFVVTGVLIIITEFLRKKSK